MQHAQTLPTEIKYGSDDGLNRTDWIWVVAAAVATVTICFLNGDQRGFWLDEAWTYEAARMGIPELVENRIRNGHSPLYFFYAKVFQTLFSTERMLRLSSALFAGVGIFGLALLARPAGLRFAIRPIVAIAAIHPYWIYMGTQYRYMMPLVAIALFVMWGALRVVERPTLGRSAAMFGLSLLFLFIHATCQFVMFAILIFLVAESLSRPEGRWRTLATSCIPVLVAFALSLLLLLAASGNAAEFADKRVDAGDFLVMMLNASIGEVTIWHELFDTPRVSYTNTLALIYCASVLVALVELFRRGRGRTARLLLALFLGIPAFMLASLNLVPNFQGPHRYMASMSIVSVISLGVAWRACVGWARGGNAPRGAWKPRAVRIAALGLCVAIVYLLAAQSTAVAIYPGDGHRQAVRWVVRHRQDGDVIMAILAKATRHAMRFHGYHGPMHTRLDAAERDVGEVRKWIAEGLAESDRAFVLCYKTRVPLRKAVEEAHAAGELVDYRLWKITDVTWVAGVIDDPAAREWLEGLEAPRYLFGDVDENRPIPPEG